MAGKQSANSTGMSIRRNGRIDFLRCLFAVIIMLHHSRYVLGYDNSIFIGGSMAVEFFFMVSGYLMMNTVPKRCAADRKNGTKPEIGSETWQFLRHKIRAFLPEFLIAWCIGFVLVATIENYHGVHLWHVFRDDFFELSLLKMSGIFTGGVSKFDSAYKNGIFDLLVTTNLVYQPEELRDKPYYVCCDMSKFLALIIDTLNHDASLSALLDPVDRIHKVVKKYQDGEKI